MKLFDLPISTEINRVIPKNSFDNYTNTKQKKHFTEYIDKIRWLNKLSKETVNLSGSDVKEIQVFEVSLKVKTEIQDLLDVIDRYIPYHIIFIIKHGNEYRLRASYKHSHPSNDNLALIDWTFSTEWLKRDHVNYGLTLKLTLDYVFTDFCKRLSGRGSSNKSSITDIIEYERKLIDLKKNIAQIEKSLKQKVQFNKKVEINLELQKLYKELNTLVEKV